MEISQISITINLTDDKGKTTEAIFRPQINLPPREIGTDVDSKGKIEDDKTYADMSDDEFKKIIEKENGNQEENTA